MYDDLVCVYIEIDKKNGLIKNNTKIQVLSIFSEKYNLYQDDFNHGTK